MESQASGSSTYRSLAQQQAEVIQRLEPTALPRFAQLCRSVEPVSAVLVFGRDDQNRVTVKGDLVVSVVLGCHRCEEAVGRQIEAIFTAVLAFTEEEAASRIVVQPDTEVIVVTSPNLDVAELVEDELILALPDRVCVEEDCVNMPAMWYGVEQDEANGEARLDKDTEEKADVSRRFPFAGLKDAMRDADDTKP